MKKWRTFAILFCIGGFGYNLVEVLWRGYSHWSMFFVGGGCFHLIGRIGARLKGKSLMLKSGLCALGVTVVEYITGCLVNRRWKLNVWDYSHMRGNLNGQVCPLYTGLWAILSLPVMPLYAFLEGQISASGQRSQRGARASQISLPNSTSR